MARADSSLPSSLADVAALGKLWEEHAPKLLAMVRRRIDKALAVRLDAEDVMQEAYVDASRKWSKFKAQSAMTPYAWLYGVVRDRLIEIWRRETRAGRDLRRHMPLPEQSSIQLAMGLIASGTGPRTGLERRELQELLRQQVQQVLALLKESDREILWMRHNDGLSHQEIAAVLDIKENAATVRYHRALGRLSDLWLQLHPKSSDQH
jgi:RNA polymerase sigma-70 factor (ECF subfamily)